jgi:uncharacterized protein YbbC (DUF1343 family)/CubicO group peptidase (beta-lactamase class C family)
MRTSVVVLTCSLAVGNVIGAISDTSARDKRLQSVSRHAKAPVHNMLEGFDAERLRRVDGLVEDAIRDHLLPGAVVLVGRGDRVVSLRAYGDRALIPDREPMTSDTLFDLASLTKVVATTTSTMMLMEQGRIRLSDRVSSYIPGFERYGKQNITIRHLLMHVSGLRPDVDLPVEWQGYEKGIDLCVEEVPIAAPGERFVYSDINFVLLGEIVRRVSGETLDEFTRRHIFDPLGMRETMFRPPERLRARIAPTERCAPLAWPCAQPNAPVLRGVVHDPTARRMGGIAGHAGLFSTAGDLAIFCRMLLHGGELNGVRMLSALTVAKMTQPQMSSEAGVLRGLGWDIDSPNSANRGELFPVGSFGHTGFTGTSIWIDPLTHVFVIFLSNRVHPDGKGDVTPLRAKVATTVAAALVDSPTVTSLRTERLTGSDFSSPAPTSSIASTVVAGVDVLRADGFSRLRGKRVALLTNLAARARDGMSTFDLLRGAPDVRLVAIFSPEHGLEAAVDTKVTSSTEKKTGVAVYSLYGETERPSSAMLEGLDAIVVDLVDVGARFYTYATTTAYVMEEAARHKLPLVVLDRPNPINGFSIEGPMTDSGITGLTAYLSMPIRHGLTLGELIRLYNAERNIGADVTVITATGWSRDRWFDETGLVWSNPSPNMRNLLEAMLYPGIGAIEWSNISVGRGTDAPFEQIGAPWIDGTKLAAILNARQIPGVRFYPVRFTPSASVYANQECSGVFIIVTDRGALRPVRVGVEIAGALQKLHPDKYDLDRTVKLLGSQESVDRIKRGEDPASIAASWAHDEANWRLRRAKYLLY